MVKYLLKSGKEIYLDEQLQHALDTLVYNVHADWDFMIVITGDRLVRSGKSVLAMTIGSYLADRLGTSFSLENIFFDSQEMINSAAKMPKYSVIVFDEGREALATSKTMYRLQIDLIDYFAECGQLNHIFIIVLPDFFELKESIAVARSECLINVYRKHEEKMMDLYKDGVMRPLVRFERGYFEFFSRKRKQELYDKSRSTNKRHYGLVKANFIGRFTNNYPLDEVAYRKCKADSLARFNEKKAIDAKAKPSDVIRDTIIFDMYNKGVIAKDIAERLESGYKYRISIRQIRRIIARLKETIHDDDEGAGAYGNNNLNGYEGKKDDEDASGGGL